MHIHQEIVVQSLKQLLLAKDRLDLAFADDSSFTHLFHCENLLSLLILSAPNLAKTTLTDDKLKVEISLAH